MGYQQDERPTEIVYPRLKEDKLFMGLKPGDEDIIIFKKFGSSFNLETYQSINDLELTDEQLRERVMRSKKEKNIMGETQAWYRISYSTSAFIAYFKNEGPELVKVALTF